MRGNVNRWWTDKPEVTLQDIVYKVQFLFDLQSGNQKAADKTWNGTKLFEEISTEQKYENDVVLWISELEALRWYLIKLLTQALVHWHRSKIQ